MMSIMLLGVEPKLLDVYAMIQIANNPTMPKRISVAGALVVGDEGLI